MVGGIGAVIFNRIAGGDASALPELLPELTFVTLAPFLGHDAAWEAAQLAREK